MSVVDAPLPPSRSDPVVAGAARVLSGPVGRHARGPWSRWWTPLRVLLALTVLTCVAGYLAKSPCRTHAWSGEFQYTRVCYTDVYALYFAEHLGDRIGANGLPSGQRMSVPYRDHPVEYPAVIGGLMWAAAEITNAVHPNDPHVSHGLVVDRRGKTFFDLTVLGLATCALVTTFALARLAGRQRMWDAAMFALAPGLFFHAYTNWDLAAVAFATLGLWAWSSRRPVLAGVLLGLGIATKLYPVLLLLALLFLCIRAARMRAWLSCAASAAVTFVVATLPAVVLSAQTPTALRSTIFQFPDSTCASAHYLPGWRWFWTLNTNRGADWDTLWFQLQHARGSPLDNVSCGQAPVWLNFWVAVATLFVIGAVSLLVLAARRRPRLAQVAFLLVAGFLLVNKVDSPQYVLWLLPLAVLARPRWGTFLAWQAAEVALLFARFYYFVGVDKPGQGAPIQVFFVAVGVRDLALGVLMGLVVRDVLRPGHDVVRATGRDDPAGGVLDAAPDRWGSGPTSARPAYA